jgi:co-chaperonin GroES (HSP10)
VLIREEDPRSLNPDNFLNKMALAADFEDDCVSGVVVAVGPGDTDQRGNPVKIRVTPGQRVYFNPAIGEGTVFNDGTGSYRFMRDSDIGMILT